MNPAFLLDSSVCIAVLRNQAGLGELPDPALTGVSVIVAAELWTGVKKNLSTHPHQAAKLEAFLDLFFIPDFTLGRGARRLDNMDAIIEQVAPHFR